MEIPFFSLLPFSPLLGSGYSKGDIKNLTNMLRELDVVSSNPFQLQYDWNPGRPRTWVSAQKFQLCGRPYSPKAADLLNPE